MFPNTALTSIPVQKMFKATVRQSDSVISVNKPFNATRGSSDQMWHAVASILSIGSSGNKRYMLHRYSPVKTVDTACMCDFL